MEQRVAITGIGAVSPLGNTALATWAAMCAGTCGVGPITHFDTDAFAVKVAAEVKGFDGNEYFGKRDAKHLDPCVQFAMAASDEAMHDAGFDVEGAIDRERLASTWLGRGRHDDARRQRPYDCRTRAPPRIALYDRDDDPQHGIGQYRNPPQGKGPDPARGDRVRNLGPCGGRGVPRHQARLCRRDPRGRRRGRNYPRCRCGLYVLPRIDHQPRFRDGLPSVRCRPRWSCDGRRAPVCSCSESMEHAQARGAHIYAEVVGYGNTDDAYHITSPDPEAAGIARAISLAVTEGDVKPSEGLYINAHGTSTKLNDSSETAGIKRALGEDAARARTSRRLSR